MLIADQFARLSNDVQHEIARQTAMLLFDSMNAIVINDIAEKLLDNRDDKDKIDWVNLICKKLPLSVVLKSFDFNDEDCDFISGKTEQLVKIMLPNKTHEQVRAINEFSKELYVITEEHLLKTSIYKSIIRTLFEKYKIEIDKIISLCVSNLIGLFIQGYDACRGVLSNSLLQVLNKKNLFNNNFADKEYLKKLVIETLRFDPPVHNTRRIAVDDIVLKNDVIKKGEAIFVVLASANRDPQQFANPTIFDINRANNSEHLTFGIGPHECLANYFSVSLATETLSYFLGRYKKIRLLEKNIVYEPMINARLPKNIWISLS